MCTKNLRRYKTAIYLPCILQLVPCNLHSSVNQMRKQSVSQLRLKPGAFRGHYHTAVGNVKELLYAYGIQAESHLHFPAVHSFLQLCPSLVCHPQNLCADQYAGL